MNGDPLAVAFIAVLVTFVFAVLALAEKVHDRHLSDADCGQIADHIIARADAAGLTVDQWLDAEMWEAGL